MSAAPTTLRAATLVLLCAAAATAAQAAWICASDDGWLALQLGACRWLLALLCTALALLPTLLLVRRLRSGASSVGAAAAPALFRVLAYACFAALLAQLVFVNHPHAGLWPVLAALALSIFPLALVCGATRGNPLLRTLDKLCLSLCVLALAGEVLLRVVAHVAPSPVFEPKDLSTAARTRIYGFEPGQVHLGFACNARGFYDSEFAAKRAGDERLLVVAIGDSFSSSVVPHAFHFSTVCERALPGCEVLNVGLATAGPQDYLQWLRDEALPLHPDLIVIDVFVGNDLRDAARGRPAPTQPVWVDREEFMLWRVPERLTRLRQERVRREQGVHELARDFAPLLDEARDISALRGVALCGVEELERTLPHLRDPLREIASFSSAKFLEFERDRLLDVCEPPAAELDALFECLIEMRRAAGTTPLAVMLIPDELQVEDAVWDATLASFGARDGVRQRVLERQRAQRLVSAWLAEHGIPTLDLLPALRAVAPLADGLKHCYHLRDTHFNARGNEVAGRALASFIQELRAR